MSDVSSQTSLLLHAASVPSSTQWDLLILLILQLEGLGEVLREERRQRGGGGCVSQHILCSLMTSLHLIGQAVPRCGIFA